MVYALLFAKVDGDVEVAAESLPPPVVVVPRPLVSVDQCCVAPGTVRIAVSAGFVVRDFALVGFMVSFGIVLLALAFLLSQIKGVDALASQTVCYVECPNAKLFIWASSSMTNLAYSKSTRPSLVL